jgi:hypothetical protein
MLASATLESFRCLTEHFATEKTQENAFVISLPKEEP